MRLMLRQQCMGEEEDFEIILPFDSDDLEFVRGFALGMVWARTSEDPPHSPVLLYASCIEMLMRMREAGGEFDIEIVDDDWLIVIPKS